MQQRSTISGAAARQCQLGPTELCTALLLEVLWSLAFSVLCMARRGCEERP